MDEREFHIDSLEAIAAVALMQIKVRICVTRIDDRWYMERGLDMSERRSTAHMRPR